MQDVFVYYNSHKQCWSIRSIKTGKVIQHAGGVVLANATFAVSEAGRKRVIKEKKKNVHAGVRGQLIQAYASLNGDAVGKLRQRVSYNPYKYKFFYKVKDSSPIFEADRVIMCNEAKVYV